MTATVPVVFGDEARADSIADTLATTVEEIEPLPTTAPDRVPSLLCTHPVGCLVTGSSLRGMTGVALVRAARGLVPELPVVFCASDQPDDVDVHWVQPGSTDEVVASVRSAVTEACRFGPTPISTLLDSMFEELPVHLFAKDRAGRHVRTSQALFDPTDVLGLTDMECGEEPQSYNEATYGDDLDVITGSERVIEREEYSDQYDMHLLTSKVPWRDADGDVVGLVGISQDITERKERERAAYRRAERLRRVAITAAHELRNELQIAAGQLEAAQRGDPEALASIERSHERLQARVDQVVRLATASREPFDEQDVHLSTIARQVWSNIDSGEASISIPNDRWLRADPGRTRLLFAAVFRASLDNGSSRIVVRGTKGGFSITDDGQSAVGPPESAFEAALDDSLEESYGLYLVSDIVDDHGWSIETGESESGGTRFDVSGVETVQRS